MKFEELTPEQQEKAKGCKSPEEVLQLAKEEGYELTAEELETISGGMVDLNPPVGGVGSGGWSF